MQLDRPFRYAAAISAELGEPVTAETAPPFRNCGYSARAATYELRQREDAAFLARIAATAVLAVRSAAKARV